MEQQNINLIKQRKSLPIELLVNIFNIASDISLNDLNICKKICCCLLEKDEIKKYWHKIVINFLTSSGRFCFFAKDNFRKMEKEGETFEANLDRKDFLSKINKQIIDNEKQFIVGDSVHNCEWRNRYNTLLKEMKIYLESKEEQEGQQPSTSTGVKRKKLTSTAKTWCEVCQIEVCSSYYKAHCKSGKHLDMLQDLKTAGGEN
ncbi:hypothetical protein Mgra_00006986 [Meloidogyne graminicola]|uniref:Uncharacterized protein n=1 Tax=Meloidogyne graminicola TaxID=189291 RepID=A0A8S9ZJV2_9BILA|nr:hypothetical protein Mgra_00006986 [Meloidogyne graminicola]